MSSQLDGLIQVTSKPSQSKFHGIMHNVMEEILASELLIIEAGF